MNSCNIFKALSGTQVFSSCYLKQFYDHDDDDDDDEYESVRATNTDTDNDNERLIQEEERGSFCSLLMYGLVLLLGLD